MIFVSLIDFKILSAVTQNSSLRMFSFYIIAYIAKEK